MGRLGDQAEVCLGPRGQAAGLRVRKGPGARALG